MEINSKNWDNIWIEREKSNEDWDYLSEVVLQVLKKEIGPIMNKKIVETGSGSGRISCRLVGDGAHVTLLDYSLVALNMSRKWFGIKECPGNFVQADIDKLPFKDNSFDVVWNGGVLEHYDHKQQITILEKLINITSVNGLTIVINPYSRSIVYMLGKKLLMSLKRWPFGEERAVRSIYDILKDKGKDYKIKEYSIGFIVCFIDAYKFLPVNIQKLKIFDMISRFFIKITPGLSGLDRMLSCMFGGYLIVSVIKRTGE